MPADNSYYQTLPKSPDLDSLKRQAKLLKKQFDARDQTAMDFVSFHIGNAKTKLKLADAQFAIAKSYGFKSWPRLKAFVEAHSLSLESSGDLLLRSVFEANYSLLEELYSRREQLSSLSIFTAAVLGDLAAVESRLKANPDLASSVGGPRQTQPITYVAHTPFGMWDEGFAERQQRIAQLLLQYGADPNAVVLEEGRGKDGNGRLSALYGCCRHRGNPALAEILLAAGANPDDGESLYHASELQDTRCLELLFAVGIDKESREYCIVRALDQENAKAVDIYLRHGTDPNHLDWALFRQRSLEVIQLLVAHGADLNRCCPDHWLLQRIKGLTPIQIAERNGNSGTVGYFLRRGAMDNRTPKDRLIGACARADRNEAYRILQQYPALMESFTQQDHANLAAFARAGCLTSVELMLDIGFDVEARADDLNATAVLYAATTGDVPMLELLVRSGARLDVTHKYGGTPLGTAIYSAAYFMSPLGDYPRAVECLINAGAPIRDEHLAFATEHDLDEIAEVLKSHGAAL